MSAEREELARLLDEADDRWQHGIGSGGYDPNGAPFWLADAILSSDWLRKHEAQTLRDAADVMVDEMADVWGGSGSWLTTGERVAGLLADVLRARADRIEGGEQ